MPHLQSTYRAPWPYRHPHLNTIVSAALRRVQGVHYTRTVLETPDDDFLDLDWLREGYDRLLILLHGLEGASSRPYMKGMARHFHRNDWDVLALNFRSCGGRINRQVKTYHMGATEDVACVVAHALEQGYEQLALVGFSLGGNVLIKYFGEQGDQLPAAVIGGVAFSVPCHIPSANEAIAHRQNRIYLGRFLRSLNAKMKEKARRFPDQVKLPATMPRTFYEFDEHFTGPMHGFRGAEHYWEACSGVRFIGGIRRPLLLVNALDDTFLAPPCYPVKQAADHPYFQLETPRHGGHCGFMKSYWRRTTWSEERALAFLRQLPPRQHRSKR